MSESDEEQASEARGDEEDFELCATSSWTGGVVRDARSLVQQFRMWQEMVAEGCQLHWQLEPAGSGMPGQGSVKRERQAEVKRNLVAAGITQVGGARKRSLMDVEQSAAISGADAAGMSLPKLDEVTVWLPNQADPVCVECDGQGVRAWFKGKTPKPCLPWLLAVRTGRASKSCPFMGKVGHENGNSQCHKSGPDWLTARLRFVPKRFHAALLWTGVAGVTAAATPEVEECEKESELEEDLAEDLFWDNGVESQEERQHAFWLAGPDDDEVWSAEDMLKVKQARRSEQLLVAGLSEDVVWPEKDMRQVLLARQKLVGSPTETEHVAG